MRRQWIRSGLLGKWWSWRGAWGRVIVLPGLSVALRWPHGAAGHARRHGARPAPPADTSAYRSEKDSFGPIDVPAGRLWGAQTQRSLQYFAISGERMAPELL